jgi:hypothetical protein
MKSQLILKDAESVKRLAERLSQCTFVAKFDHGAEKEAWTLAHSFQDIEQSLRNFLDKLLPKLFDGKLSESEIHEVLLEIGEEFRHVLYHVKDPKFYRYLYSDQ